jgi:hypothetical protein
LADLGTDEEGVGMMAHLGRVYKGYLTRLKIYSTYIAGFEPASELLKEWQEEATLGVFLEDKKAGGALPLGALLIQPVQRICRYPLLFQEVLKHTPEDHSDYQLIKDLMDDMEQVTVWINESKQKEFNLKKMEELEELMEDVPPNFDLNVPGRKVVAEGKYKISSTVGNENATEVQLTVFNDMMLWVRPSKRSELLKYEGHLFFDRMTRAERLGLDLVQVESRDKQYFVQAKDLVTTEHLYSFLSETIKARTSTLNLIYSKRVESAQLERQRLVARVAAFEVELATAQKTVSAQEKKMAFYVSMIKDLCKECNKPVPADLTDMSNLGSTGSSASSSSIATSKKDSLSPASMSAGKKHSRRLSHSPKVSQLNVNMGEVSPFVVMAKQDHVSEDPEELSFSFGELILVSQDFGEYYIGRPYEGEIFAEKRVFDKHVVPMVKRGNAYVRVDKATALNNSSSTGGGPAGSRRATTVGKSSGAKSFLGAINRSVEKVGQSKPMRSSGDLVSILSPSPSLRKKTIAHTPDRNSSGSHRMVPSLNIDGEKDPANVDHSQEMILKTGYLKKIGGNRKNWKRRFFFLSEKHMYYYESEKIAGKKPLGIVNLAAALSIERSRKFDEGFQIPFGDRLWEFRAESLEESMDWFNAIEGVIRRNRKSNDALQVNNPVFGLSRRRNSVSGPKAVVVTPPPTPPVDESEEAEFDNDVYDL